MKLKHLLLAAFPTVFTLAGAPATGPAVGSIVPAFKLSDQNGQPQTLASIAGPKGAMLVFYRSADW